MDVNSRIAVCPGSFDPVTNGHLDVVRRAASLFDEVIVAVGINASKSALLEADERVRLFEQAVEHMPNVRVERMDGLLVDLCREHGADLIVKGLRGGADFDDEQPMAAMNRHLSGVETLFLITDAAVSHISSSLVKDVAQYGGNITDMVPAPVADAVYRAFGTHPPKEDEA
ncbi:MAG TPA: pantetheine-phosphate adenylyltransferase [Beutenbergiaceae bacterium]|nr:pantetheine-phosphate adenylyltransferase [Beutenbergiaceae bacterium]